MRNVRNNSQGLAAWNLWLNNEWVMAKYEWRNRHTLGYPPHWGRKVKNIILALLTGWTPTKIRTERQWAKAVERRLSEDQGRFRRWRDGSHRSS